METQLNNSEKSTINSSIHLNNAKHKARYSSINSNKSIKLSKKKVHLKAETLQVKQLKMADIEIMYNVFSSYYKKTSKKSFQSDLLQKTHIILLRNLEYQIKGFSTITQSNLRKARGIGVFSGDTVIEKNYWGSNALGKAFLKHLWNIKLKNIHKPVYWFLISKGYKTYLLMANNFPKHYPRYEEETPKKYKKIMDSFYAEKFGSFYNAKEGLIYMEDSYLKSNIADITQDLLKVPRISFFQNKNPEWSKGTELACIAEMDFLMPFRYAIKKRIRK